ncbi:hypothetical protein GHT80_26150, partial [Pseudomonas aeruginosa]|nr:hypothetical protein [Pseudomonas aeruginosa]
MDELDFSGLSDDQLVELAIAIAKEAARRNPALQAAFAEALATEREKIDARLRGAERARQYEIQQAERVAEAASKAVADEKMRSKRTELLRRYLARISHRKRCTGPSDARKLLCKERFSATTESGPMQTQCNPKQYT